jgi:hypothetical protein
MRSDRQRSGDRGSAKKEGTGSQEGSPQKNLFRGQWLEAVGGFAVVRRDCGRNTAGYRDARQATQATTG